MPSMTTVFPPDQTNPAQIVVLKRDPKETATWRVTGLLHDDSLVVEDRRLEKLDLLRKVVIPKDVQILDMCGAQIWIENGQPRPFKQQVTKEQFEEAPGSRSIRGTYFWLGRVSDEPLHYAMPWSPKSPTEMASTAEFGSLEELIDWAEVRTRRWTNGHQQFALEFLKELVALRALYDRRVTELLEANNALVERERAAIARAESYWRTIELREADIRRLQEPGRDF